MDELRMGECFEDEATSEGETMSRNDVGLERDRDPDHDVPSEEMGRGHPDSALGVHGQPMGGMGTGAGGGYGSDSGTRSSGGSAGGGAAMRGEDGGSEAADIEELLGGGPQSAGPRHV